MASIESTEKKWKLFDKINGNSVPEKFVKHTHKKLTDNQYHKLFFEPIQREIRESINFDVVLEFISNCKEKTLLLECKKASKARLDYLYSQEKLEV